MRRLARQAGEAIKQIKSHDELHKITFYDISLRFYLILTKQHSKQNFSYNWRHLSSENENQIVPKPFIYFLFDNWHT